MLYLIGNWTCLAPGCNILGQVGLKPAILAILWPRNKKLDVIWSNHMRLKAYRNSFIIEVTKMNTGLTFLILKSQSFLEFPSTQIVSKLNFTMKCLPNWLQWQSTIKCEYFMTIIFSRVLSTVFTRTSRSGSAHSASGGRANFQFWPYLRCKMIQNLTHFYPYHWPWDIFTVLNMVPYWFLKRGKNIPGW